MSPTPNPSPVKREGLKYRLFPFPSLRGEGVGVRGTSWNLSDLITRAMTGLQANSSIWAIPAAFPAPDLHACALLHEASPLLAAPCQGIDDHGGQQYQPGGDKFIAGADVKQAHPIVKPRDDNRA